MNLMSMADSYSFALFLNDANPTGDHFSREWLDRISAYQQGTLETGLTFDPNTRRYNPQYNGGANANVDWGHEMFNKHSFAQEHNLSVNGGSEKFQIYGSANYLDMQGLLKYGEDTFNRLNTNIKANVQIRKWLSVQLTSRYSRTDYERPTEWNSGNYMNLLRNQWPLFPVLDDNGNPNPEVTAYTFGRKRTFDNTSIFTNQFNVKITPLKDWNIVGDVAIEDYHNSNRETQKPIYLWDVDGNMIPKNANSSVRNETTQRLHYTYSLYTDYSLRKGKHFAKATVGMQAENLNKRFLSAKKTGLISENVTEIDNTTGIDPTTGEVIAPVVGGNYNKWATAGFFGRVNYVYDDRYMFEANVRYDGSSRFRPDSRWVVSPSFSVGWNIANESFWEPVAEYVNNLKLRASYGSLANQNTMNWYPTYSIMQLKTGTGNWLIDNMQTNAANAPSLVSANLTWETVITSDVGLDFGFFDNRLTGSFDLYIRDTKDMVGPSAPLPTNLGLAVPKSNNTSLRTKGWELSLNWQDILKCGFRYSVGLNLSNNKTEITEYSNSVKTLDGYYEGKRVGDIWGFTTMGIAKSDREMRNHLISLPNGGQSALGYGWTAGDIMYDDVNGDGKIDFGDNTIDNPGDQRIIGNSNPKYRMGLTLAASWKGIDFSVFFQGVLKRDWAPNYQGPNPDGNIVFWGYGYSVWYGTPMRQHLDYFRADPDHPLGQNLDSYYPRPIFSEAVGGQHMNKYVQTRYLQNAAYVRLKNLQVGYTLPEKITRKIGLQKVRVYVSGENLATWTKLSSLYDPEMIDGGFWGMGYPLYKTWSTGLNITF